MLTPPSDPPRARTASHVADRMGRAILMGLVALLAIAPAHWTANAAEGDPVDTTPRVSVQDSAAPEKSADETAVLRFTVTATPPPGDGNAVHVSYKTEDVTAKAGLDYVSSSGELVLEAGEAEAIIEISVLDDESAEGSETLQLRLSQVQGGVLERDIGAGTIVDDEATPTVSVSDAAALEGDSLQPSALFVLTLSRPADEPVRLAFATHDGTATVADGDYESTQGVVVFAPGETNLPVEVDVLDDVMREGDEHFLLALSDAVNAVIDRPLGTGTIMDDEVEPTVAFESESSSRMEGQDPKIPVRLSRPSTRPVSVNYSVARESADEPPTHLLPDGALVFRPGETTKDISGATADDSIPESDQTLVITLNGPIGGTLGEPSTHRFTIQDNDGAPSLSIGDAQGPESGPELRFNVTLSGPSARDVSVGYRTIDDTARASHDYKTSHGTASFAAGQTVQTIAVPLLDDATDESPERFLLELHDASNATLTDGTGEGIILDDDPAARLTVRDATTVEGDTGPGALEFVVELSPPSDFVVEASYETVDVTASHGDDYDATAGRLSFPRGATSRTVAVPIRTDTLHERDEALLLRLSDAPNATLARPVAVGTIVDDDPMPYVFVTAPTATIEQDPSSGPPAQVTFTVQLSSASSQPALVAYATEDGTAKAGLDYVPSAGVLSFAPGERFKTASVLVAPDDVDEADENFNLVLGQVHGAQATPEDVVASAVIRDDDLPVVVVTIEDPTANEQDADPARIVVRRMTADHTSALEVRFALEGSAKPPGSGAADYSTDPPCNEPANCRVVIPPNEEAASITLVPSDDAAVEDPETVHVRLRDAAAYTIGPSAEAEAVLFDNDLPTVDVEALDANADEANLDPGVFLFRRTTPDARLPLRVSYVVAGTATDRDYVPLIGDVVIPAGSLTAQERVTPINDTESEPFEELTVSLVDRDEYHLGPSRDATVVIRDDDRPLFELRTVEESAAEEGKVRARFELHRTRGTAIAVEVRVEVGGTASNGLDYGTVLGEVDFAANQRTAFLNFVPVDDDRHESRETITAELVPSPSYNLAQRVKASAFIEDNDLPKVSLVLEEADASETASSSAVVRIHRESDHVAEPLPVMLNATGTAQSGSDYLPFPMQVTIPADQRDAVVAVTPVDDELDEEPETVHLRVEPDAGYALDDAAAVTATIADDDAPQVTLEIVDGVAQEAQTEPARLAVRRHSDDLRMELTVHYEARGSATDGTDYRRLPGRTTIPAGQTTAPLLVEPFDDDRFEDNESVTLTLLASADYVLGIPASVDVLILDNRDPVISIHPGPPSVAENSTSPAAFRLARNASNLTQSLVVHYTVNGTAQNGTDYQALPGVAVFEAGQEFATVPIVPMPDALDEPNETIALKIAEGFGYRVGRADNASVTILDGNLPLVTARVKTHAAEGAPEPGRVHIIRHSTDLVGSLLVAYDVGGDAENGEDYVRLSGRTQIPPGASIVTLDVQAIQDALDEPTETVAITILRTADVEVSGASAVVVMIADSTDPPPPETSQGAPAGTIHGKAAPASVGKPTQNPMDEGQASGVPTIGAAGALAVLGIGAAVFARWRRPRGDPPGRGRPERPGFRAESNFR